MEATHVWEQAAEQGMLPSLRQLLGQVLAARQGLEESRTQQSIQRLPGSYMILTSSAGSLMSCISEMVPRSRAIWACMREAGQRLQA